MAGLVLAIVGREARAAELAAPDDERVFEQAALFEIVEQRGDRRIGGVRSWP